jgi:hypothetical protein
MLGHGFLALPTKIINTPRAKQAQARLTAAQRWAYLPDKVKITDLMREMDVEIDDLRWYLATQQAERLLLYRGRPAELARLIWSGSLEQELYDMEERLVLQLQQDLDQGLRDEGGVREILSKAVAARAGRYAPQAERGDCEPLN